MLTFLDAFSIIAIGILCIYWALNHIDLDALYIDLKLDTWQHDADTHLVTDGSN